IVNLVIQGLGRAKEAAPPPLEEMPPVSTLSMETQPVDVLPVPVESPVESGNTNGIVPAPRGGVEIIGAEQRNNTRYYILRDLRNGNTVKNVTRSSARRLWHYAISQHESNPMKADKV